MLYLLSLQLDLEVIGISGQSFLIFTRQMIEVGQGVRAGYRRHKSAHLTEYFVCSANLVSQSSHKSIYFLLALSTGIYSGRS